MTNVVKWFAIPANNLSRAIRFYETVLNVKLKQEHFHDQHMAIFPKPSEDVTTGALVEANEDRPAGHGAIIYLEAGDLDAALGRVSIAGGNIVKGKTSIGPMGTYAIISDTEGNQIGLHVNA